MIRLDHLASTPVHAEVAAAMRPWWEEGTYGIPAHRHGPGLRAAEALESARAGAAALLGVEAEEIVFTSSGTESANMALCGWAWKHPGAPLAASAAEHPAVLETLRFLERQGHPLRMLPVDGQGRIEMDGLESGGAPGLLACHLANHDSGTVQAVDRLGAKAHEAGWEVFCDAAYGGGWVPWEGWASGADMISLAPHRFFGPQGIGVLAVRRGLALEPLIHGGRQQGGRRAGTEAVALAAGAGVACARMQRMGALWRKRVASLRGRLWEGLQSGIEDIVLHGPPPGPERDPRHLAVGIRGVEGEALMLLLDLRGVAVIAASGCLNGREKYSSVLRAMGVEEALVRGTLILAPTPEQDEAEMDEAARIIARAVAKIRAL
jgi:cysteine desulfurase